MQDPCTANEGSTCSWENFLATRLPVIAEPDPAAEIAEVTDQIGGVPPIDATPFNLTPEYWTSVLTTDEPISATPLGEAPDQGGRPTVVSWRPLRRRRLRGDIRVDRRAVGSGSGPGAAARVSRAFTQRYGSATVPARADPRAASRDT